MSLLRASQFLLQAPAGANSANAKMQYILVETLLGFFMVSMVKSRALYLFYIVIILNYVDEQLGSLEPVSLDLT